MNNINFELTLSSQSYSRIVNDTNYFVRFSPVSFIASYDNVSINDYIVSYEIILTDGNKFNVNDVALTYQFDFDVNNIGIYEVFVTVENIITNDSFIYETKFGCFNSFEFEYTECGTYALYNNSDVDIVILISNTLNADTQTVEVLANTNESVTLDSPAIYILSLSYIIDDELTTEVYLISNHCIIENCLANLILNVLCSDERECKECSPDEYIYQLQTMMYAYNMALNAEYNNANFYTLIDNDKATQIASYQELLTKIVDFCEAIGCLNNSDTNYKYGCQSCH